MQQQIGPYRVEREIGRGGMGVVYRGRDTRLGRLVAIKALTEDMAEDIERIDRLRREAKVLASLNHPNIAAIHDVVETNRLYLILEYVVGSTLDELMRNRPLALQEALDITKQVTAALSAAHGHGIIHRDLKPQNLIVTGDGLVKVLDFGLARAEVNFSDSTQIAMTHPGQVMGTFGYMAPEQARASTVDARCDLFSLGCILYEMLSGRNPFARSNRADCIAAVLGESPPQLAALGVHVPEAVQTLIDRCLQKDRQKRFASASEVLSALVDMEAEPSPLVLGRPRKLCVCGRSQTLPFCDESHGEGDGWTCRVDTQLAPMAFCSSQRYQNLTYKLASHYQGVLCLPGHPWPVADRLVTIVDGGDLEHSLQAQEAVTARQRVVFALGVKATALAPVFPNCRMVDLGDTQPLEVFNRIRAVLDDPSGSAVPASGGAVYRSAFVCHAVNDEATIMPVVDVLRHFYDADVFICADSIPGGANWQEIILTAMREKERFVIVLSEATLASPFCSFEMGAASALGKPMRVISVDGSKPPTFIQHLQTSDVLRLTKQTPWLDTQDILLHEFLSAITDSSTSGTSEPAT